MAMTMTMTMTMIMTMIFLVWRNFFSYQEKTLQKRQSKETKYNTKKKKENIYITMYNYKLYTIARLVSNKSIQAVQLIY